MENKLTFDKIYEDYLDVIQRCTSDIRNRTDEEILYDLFEQFDSGALTMLHEDTLLELHDAGFIDDAMVELSKEVRKRWLNLQPPEKQECNWTVEEIKTKKEWQELFELCDRLKLKAMSLSTAQTADEGYKPLPGDKATTIQAPKE